MNVEIRGFLRTCMIIGIVTLAHSTAYGTETCPPNGSGPDICLDWNQTGSPIAGLHFAVDYTTDPANPDVTLMSGAGWNVRSVNDGGVMDNIGDIKIDATDPRSTGQTVELSDDHGSCRHVLVRKKAEPLRRQNDRQCSVSVCQLFSRLAALLARVP